MSFTLLNRRFWKRWPPAQSIVKPKTPDDPQGFPDDFALHFGGALEAVGEDDGNFADAQALPPEFVGHLNLEAVAIGMYVRKVNGLQR